jgi:hypothetical protein
MEADAYHNLKPEQLKKVAPLPPPPPPSTLELPPVPVKVKKNNIAVGRYTDRMNNLALSTHMKASNKFNGVSVSV